MASCAGVQVNPATSAGANIPANYPEAAADINRPGREWQEIPCLRSGPDCADEHGYIGPQQPGAQAFAWDDRASDSKRQ